VVSRKYDEVMKNLVTGFGGSVVLGHYIGDTFKYQNKFPRKQKKELKKQKPWIIFPKSPIDYVIEKCIPKKWLEDKASFALTISNTPRGNERHVYFSVCFFDNEEITDRQIFYKRVNGNPIKNI
jgi:hypothetical protein